MFLWEARCTRMSVARRQTLDERITKVFATARELLHRRLREGESECREAFSRSGTIHRPFGQCGGAKLSLRWASVPHALAEVRRSSMTAASKKLTTVTTCAWARTALHPLPHHPRHPTTYDLTAHCNVFPFPLHAVSFAHHGQRDPQGTACRWCTQAVDAQARHCSHFSFPRKETLTSHFTSSLRHIDTPDRRACRAVGDCIDRRRGVELDSGDG